MECTEQILQMGYCIQDVITSSSGEDPIGDIRMKCIVIEVENSVYGLNRRTLKTLKNESLAGQSSRSTLPECINKG